MSEDGVELSREEESSSRQGLARCVSAVLSGIEGAAIDVEVAVGRGLPGLRLVGLPAASVKESEERVRSAVRRSGFSWPRSRVTVNLAPADLRKEGSALDLPIAIATLAASGGVSPETLAGWMILGELSLDGSIRAIRGALNYALLAREKRLARLLVPRENAPEAAFCEGVEVYGAENLAEAAAILGGRGRAVPAPVRPPDPEAEADFSEIRGLETPRRAALVAAAGGHNLLMIGPPGSGKTMIARRLPTILPPLSFDEALEMLRVHSAAGLTQAGILSTAPPFRGPHHTVSTVGLIGGGNPLRPGEISLAHRGLLFLDELPEYRRELLESLRQPLEDGYVTVTRARGTAVFPARFMLVAAMNPCPCGHLGSSTPCACPPADVARYRRRISGPLLDRIDLHVEVPRRPFAETSAASSVDGESSAVLRGRVLAARKLQEDRYGRSRYRTNAAVAARTFRASIAIDPSARQLLEATVDGLDLSARAAEKILRVARTIADLSGEESLNEAAVAEAVSYRVLDRRYR